MYHYILPCDPIPLARARFSQRKVWDSQRQVKYNCAMLLKHQHEDKPKLNGALKIVINFYFKIPTSFSPAKKVLRMGKAHTIKPDLDNLVKFILDIAQSVIYDNDCTIAHIEARKLYAEHPRTEFYIMEME